jgi:hypothetical protein
VDVGGKTGDGGEPFVTLERALLVFLLIGFVLWLIFGVLGYEKGHPQLTDSWAIGTVRLVEVSVVPEDRDALACASDTAYGSLRCRYHADETTIDPANERDVIQPLNTVKNELLLGAGLWSDLGSSIPEKGHRFTVACNFHVEVVLRSAALRWAPHGVFSPLALTAAAGHLTDCVIPK